MATPPPASAALDAVKAKLDAMVLAHERRVISIVADLVAARMETKMWTALQAAVHEYEPIGPYFGAEEVHRVWEPLDVSLRELAAVTPQEKDVPVHRRFEQLRREWLSAADEDADANVDDDPPEGSAENASSPRPNHDGGTTAASSAHLNAAIASGNMPSHVKLAPRRKGLRGVEKIDVQNRAAVGRSAGADEEPAAGSSAGTESVREDDVCSAAGDAGPARTAASLDRGIVLLESARAFGKAVMVLDTLTSSRLDEVAHDCKRPGTAAVLVPVLVSTGLATELSDALDNCSVGLLKKYVDLKV